MKRCPLLVLGASIAAALAVPAPAEAALIPLPPGHPWKRKKKPEAPPVQAPARPPERPATSQGGPPSPADLGEEIDLEALFDTEIEVATKRAQSLVEAPAVVSVVTADDLRERGYLSVAEALRALPGFYVVDDYLAPSVGVRGLPSGQRAWSRIMKVMVDGHAIAYRPEATNFLGPEGVPIDAVKRIEVIRGPGSALYGADAFLGVVNIVTKRGEDVAGGHLEAGVGAFAAHPQGLGALTVGGPLAGPAAGGALADAEFVLAGGGGLLDRSGLGVPAASPFQAKFAQARSEGDLARPGTLFGRLGGITTPLGQLAIDGLYQRLDSGGEFQDWRPFTHQSHLVLENRSVRAALRGAPAQRLGTTASLAFTRGGPGADDRIGIGNPQFQYRRDASTDAIDGTLEASYALNARDSVTLGADVAHNVHRSPTYYNVFTPASGRAGEEVRAGEPGGERTFSNLGAYGQGILHLWEDTAVTMGLRLDAHNVYGPVLNGRAGVVHPLGAGLVAKALYGSSFKAPSPLQLFGRPLIFGDILGNADLRPERAQTIEGAVSWLPSRQVELLTDAYYTHVSDKVGFVAEGGNSKALNLSESDSVGLETELRWRWQFLHGMLNLSLQKTAALVPEDSRAAETATLPEAYPAYTVNAGVGAPLGELPLGAFLEARHVGAVPTTQSNFVANGLTAYELPAATVFDATLASRDWAWGDRSVSAVLKAANLLDSDYAMPGFGGVDYPGRGRTVWMRIGYAW